MYAAETYACSERFLYPLAARRATASDVVCERKEEGIHLPRHGGFLITLISN